MDNDKDVTGSTLYGRPSALQILSLGHKADTPAGSISASEARRLSAGENLIGPSNVLLMDDLDSGTRQPQPANADNLSQVMRAN